MLSESNNFNKTFQNFPILRICVHNLKFAGPLSVKNFILPVEMELCIEMQAVACIFLHHHRSSLESIEAGIYDACFHVSAVRWVGGWVCSVHTVAFLE